MDKLSLWNDALRILGARKLASLTEEREPRYRLEEAYDFGAVDFCLELVKPRFAARTSRRVDGGLAPTSGFAYRLALPADYVGLLGVFSDANLDTPVSRYVVEGRNIEVDVPQVYLRYISNDASYGNDLTIWPLSFSKVVSSYLAKELAPRLASDKTEAAVAAFTEAAKYAIDLNGVEEPIPRSRKPIATLSQDWLNIYNDALYMCGKTYLTSVNDDSENRAHLDQALSQNLVQNLLETGSWHWAHETTKLFYDPSLNPDWGYTYVFEKPSNMIRLKGIFSDEYLHSPLKDYIDEGDYIFTNLTEIYLQYVKDDTVSQPSTWPAHFRKLVAGELAMHIVHLVQGNEQNVLREYDDRRRTALSIDAIQSPPQKIHSGSWVRAKLGGDRRNNRGRP